MRRRNNNGRFGFSYYWLLFCTTSFLNAALFPGGAEALDLAWRNNHNNEYHSSKNENHEFPSQNMRQSLFSSVQQQQQQGGLRRPLPEKILAGYATKCDEKVKTAVRQGVNVVIWAFFNLYPNSRQTNAFKQEENANGHDLWWQSSSTVTTFLSSSSLDLNCIQEMIQNLDEEGYNDTVHMVSMGGWDAPHLDTIDFETAEAWFHAWKAHVGSIFHGLDIDFEGSDDLSSRWNFFEKNQLEMTGQIMKLAKQNGYLVSIVPPQSYLDVQSTRFSRYVNMTDPDRNTFHADFHYFGQNVYAYWLANYGDFVDFVMIQFYESYSRASMEIHEPQHPMTPEGYLQFYMQDLFNKGQQFHVDFASDPELDMKSQMVSLPISKLVWGFINHQSDDNNGNERAFYFLPECVQAAYQNLWDWMIEPRGFMFWVIEAEGEKGVYYSKELNQILHIRQSSSSPIDTE